MERIVTYAFFLALILSFAIFFLGAEITRATFQTKNNNPHIAPATTSAY